MSLKGAGSSIQPTDYTNPPIDRKPDNPPITIDHLRTLNLKFLPIEILKQETARETTFTTVKSQKITFFIKSILKTHKRALSECNIT